MLPANAILAFDLPYHVINPWICLEAIFQFDAIRNEFARAIFLQKFVQECRKWQLLQTKRNIFCNSVYFYRLQLDSCMLILFEIICKDFCKMATLEIKWQNCAKFSPQQNVKSNNKYIIYWKPQNYRRLYFADIKLMWPWLVFGTYYFYRLLSRLPDMICAVTFAL